MISLLESAKLADGRNILNFSVDTAEEINQLPSGGAKWESMGHDYGVPAVGSTATLEDTGETYYLNKYLQWELVGKGEVLSSVYYVTVDEAQDGNYYSNYTFTEIKNYYEEGNGIYLKNGEDIYILSYINELSAQFVQIYNHNGVKAQSFIFSLVDGELIITKHDLSFGLLHVPTSADYTYGQTTVTYDTTDGITIHGKTKFVNTVGEDTFDSSIEIPIQGKDGITIDKDADTEFVNIRGAKAVILDALPTATNGTITEAQLAELQASTSNYIMFNNKKYTYVDESTEEGYIKYSLLDYENNDAVIKVISVTINTLSWVLNTKSGIATKEDIHDTMEDPTSFKTLFGNQHIVGNGNIDIYEHDIVITGTNLKAFLTVYSSKNTKVDSLNDLKLLCGNTFTKSCTGYVDSTAVMAITELKLLKVNGTDQLLTGVTFEDTLTTI